MTTEKGTGLFDGGDSRIALLNEVLEGLPQTKQVEHIITALQKQEVWKQKNAPSLVEALEKLSKDEIAFRAQLMELCNAIPMQVRDNHSSNKYEQVEVAADLRLVMLGKIIEGWASLRRFFDEPWHPQEDADTCFQFLCDSYEKAPLYQRWGGYPNFYSKEEPGRIRKGILELLRKHLETHHLPLDELDCRVVQTAPDPIKLVLSHARVRQAGVSLLQKEAAERLQGA